MQYKRCTKQQKKVKYNYARFCIALRKILHSWDGMGYVMTSDLQASGKIAQRWWVGNYRHNMPYPRGNLYLAIRKSLGMTQERIADTFGVGVDTWRNRERSRRNLCIAEILALHELSGLTDSEFMKLLNDIA
jgi:hypothetical protein